MGFILWKHTEIPITLMEYFVRTNCFPDDENNGTPYPNGLPKKSTRN